MNLTHKPLYQVSMELVAETLNRAFTGYIGGDLHLDTPGAHQFLYNENVNPLISKLAYADNEPAGVALVSHLGWTSRLAGMGIVPEMTNKGAGTWLMKVLLEEAHQRGDRIYTLEVIEQNEPGVRLYENCGFRIVRRLFGYNASPPHPGDGDKDLTEIDPLQVARMLSYHEPEDMPWQTACMGIAKLAPPSQGFQLGPAYTVVTPVKDTMIVLRTLVVERELRGHGHASRLLRALFALYPDRDWKIPSNFPEPPKGRNLFERLGFEFDKISQFQMKYQLT